MSILSICQAIAAKIRAVYAKGKTDGEKAQYDAFWEAYFASQQRSKASYAIQGGGWDETTFKPDRTINAENLGVTTANGLFSYTSFMEFPQFLEDGVTPTLDTSGFVSLNSFFANTKNLTHIHAPIDLSSCTNMSYAFAGASKLQKVTLKHIEKVTNWTSVFNASANLTDIGQENDDFGYFSASVDLSKTAIDFGTSKMSLCDLIDNWRQENAFIKIGAYNNDYTLTISQKQHDDAYNRLYDYSGTNFDLLVTQGMGWKLAIV